MQRLVLAVLLVALAAAVVAFAASRIARAVNPPEGTAVVGGRSSMQKIAFFLLLCLMIYVSMSGAS